MKEINSALPLSLAAEGLPETPKNKTVMGKDDFLKLLVTQLQHQDPLKPMDHQEFVAQLAQFSSLEQLSNIGTGIQGLKGGLSEEAKLQALGMIGKKVDAASEREINLVQGQRAVFGSQLGPDMKPVKASVYDSGGRLVREIMLSEKSGSEVEWDGKSGEGAPLPSGKYAFRIFGIGKDGKTQEASSDVSGRVTGVEMNGQTPVLVVQTPSGSTKVELGKVRQVSLDGENSAADKNHGASSLAAEPSKSAALAPKPGVTESEEEPSPDIEEEERGFPYSLLENQRP